MPKALRTNLSVWSAIFRKIIAKLESDPDFSRVVSRDNLRKWDGSPIDKQPFTPKPNQPIVRLTPNPSDVSWYSPDTQAGRLNVRVEVAVSTLCIDDVVDLFDVILIALRPGNQGFCDQLIALGAETGEIVFEQPAFAAQPDGSPEGYFLGEGRFSLELLRTVYP